MNEVKKYSILVVDGINSDITTLLPILSPEYIVYTVNNGKDTVKSAEKYMPDVILLGVDMTETDGYAVIAALKESKITQDIPVILIAGNNNADDEIKALSLGAADYISKPFNSDILKLRVKTQINALEKLRAVEYDIMNYKLASKAMNIALWRADALVPIIKSPDDKNIWTWSQEFRNILGFSDENDFPNTIEAFQSRLHPEDAEKAIAAFIAHFNDRTGKTPYDIEYRLRHKNGEYRYFDGFGTSLRDSEGFPLMVSGAVRDITDKKQMEKALEEALRESNNTRDILTSVLNKSNTMIAVSDVETNEILFITDHMKQHFGIEGDAIGQPCYKVLQKGMDKRCDFCPCRQLDKEPDKAIIWEEHSTLTNSYYLNTNQYVDWPGGKKAHIQYCVDLTDIKRTQESLERREKLLEIVNKMAVAFLSQRDKTFSVLMTQEVGFIADVMKLDRLSVWRNSAEMTDNLHVSMIYRWDRASGGNTEPTDIFINVRYADYAPNWEKLFEDGKSVNGIARLFTEHEAAIMKNFGIVSAFVTPVFISDVFWGFVLFEDRFNERIFDNESTEIMRAAAFLFVNAIIRDERERQLTVTTKTLDRQNNLLLSVNHAASALLTPEVVSKDFHKSLLEGMEIIGQGVDADCIEVWQNEMIDGELHAVIKHYWFNGNSAPEPAAASHSFPYSDTPDWENRLSQGECIQGTLSTLSPEDRDFVDSFGVKSLLVIPVFMENRLWGMCCIDNYGKFREFSEDEVSILRSVCYMIVSTINRQILTSEIRAANNRTKVLLDKTPLCCQLWDSNFNKIDCNEAAVKLFGFKDKQDYLQRYSELYPDFQPDGQYTKDKSLISVKKAFEEGINTLNWTYKMLDGTLMPSEITLIRVEYEDGYGVAGYTRDLREHNKMMKEIEYRDTLLLAVNVTAAYLLNADLDSFENALYKSMKVLAEAVNIHRVCIWKNHTIDDKLYCTQLYEWAENIETLCGSEITVNVSYSETLPGWEEVLSSGKCINSLVQNMSPKTRAQLFARQVVSALAVPVFVKDHFWGLIGFDDCQQERIFTEEEESILRSGGMLFTNALFRNEMTQNLRDTSVKLELALEQATAASKAKSEFLSNMSHEMRTPMNAIIGMTAIGKNTEDMEQKDYALNKIDDASSHLLAVINDVLDMAKIEANKLELTLIEYNFEKMLKKVLTIIYFRAEEKQQELSVKIDSKIPCFLIGDEQRLAQVIANILANAVKFTPIKGNIGFEASLIGEIDGNCELRIEVADNGIGISAEQQERLFNVFEQATSETSRTYGGTGLGLALSKRFIELMDGNIWIESELGKGAKFIFTVKAQRSEKSPRSLLDPDVSKENVRILAVDDMPETLIQFKDIFKRLGIECDVAVDGIEACRIIEERGEYDIYFIDWRMPGMDGVELTRRIKSCGSGNKASVVTMITAADWSQIKDEAIAAGVDKHLLKPLNSSMIIDCVNECLGTVKQDITANSDDEFTGKTMLLTEDIEINREILIALLENTGLNIDCAENGRKAVDMISAAPDKYDIVFMDIQMPVMDGFEATQLIRTLPADHAANLPIIAMTANVFKDDIEACLAAGMDDHLGKPLDVDKVFEKLRKYL